MKNEFNQIIEVELQGQDKIEIQGHEIQKLKFVGCFEMKNLLMKLVKSHGEDLKNWPIPTGVSHPEILVRELLQRLHGDWQFPYSHSELCHCRKVNTSVVDQAIIAGAHSQAEVSRQTSAGTACGTCRSDTETILAYRLGKK